MSQHPHPLVRTYTLGAYRVAPDGPLPDGRDLGPNGEPGWRQDWFIEADLLDPETGRRENYSASLVAALDMGTFTAPWEREIPPSVMRKIEALADRLAAADLF
jgi:hypothetical protein